MKFIAKFGSDVKIESKYRFNSEMQKSECFFDLIFAITFYKLLAKKKWSKKHTFSFSVSLIEMVNIHHETKE